MIARRGGKGVELSLPPPHGAAPPPRLPLKRGLRKVPVPLLGNICLNQQMEN